MKSFVEAAYTILKSEGKPLSTREITIRAINDYLIKRQGKTPITTMWESLYLENKRRQIRKQPTRFRQIENYVWGLTEWE